MDLTDIAMYCKIKQSEREADKYKQQSDLYESVLTGTVTEFVVPDEWTEIRRGAFNACTKLTSVTLSDNIATIGVTAFNFCSSLESINILDVTEIKDNAFYGCTSLVDMTISNTVTKLGKSVFTNCSKLTNVTLGSGFNCNNLDLSASTKYSVDTLAAMLTALADRTGQTAYTLTIGTTNLAKLSDEQKAIATDKNWTLA
nr:MAG TPA: leucine-rich repeat protein [Bacteriophage sp.]